MKVLLLVCISVLGFCKTPAVNYETLAMQVQKEAAEELAHKYNLHLAGFGGGMMGQINRMAIMFDYDQKVDIQAGSQMLTNCAKIFLRHVNESESIRPYLAKYPADLENIEIIIYPERTSARDFYDRIIAMSIHKNQIRFLINEKFETIDINPTMF